MRPVISRASISLIPQPWVNWEAIVEFVQMRQLGAVYTNAGWVDGRL